MIGHNDVAISTIVCLVDEHCDWTVCVAATIACAIKFSIMFLN